MSETARDDIRAALTAALDRVEVRYVAGIPADQRSQAAEDLLAAIWPLFERHTYTVPDGPKMLRETLCVAQARVGDAPFDLGRRVEHMQRLQRLMDECDRKRLLGPNGKHGDRHTPECGCDLYP